MKKNLLTVYLVIGFLVCGWFTAAAALGWKATDYGILRGLSTGSGGGYGRSVGGSWGGGK